MKTTVSKSDFIDAFRAHDRYEQFGHDALGLLFDYLEEIEQETGEEIELDVVAICCEYSVNCADDIASNYDIDLSDCEDDDEKADKVREYLEHNTPVVGECADGFVYAQF